MWELDGGRIPITPQSFGPDQRVEASRLAEECQGVGVRMEIHSGHTDYYTDATVQPGHIDVYCSMSYKAYPVYDMTLKSPTEEYVLPWERNQDEGS